MLGRLGLALALLLGLALGGLWLLGSGMLGSRWEDGDPTGAARPAALSDARAAAQRRAAREAGVAKSDQILFGDLHVHTTFSPDAFMARAAARGRRRRASGLGRLRLRALVRRPRLLVDQRSRRGAHALEVAADDRGHPRVQRRRRRTRRTRTRSPTSAGSGRRSARTARQPLRPQERDPARPRRRRDPDAPDHRARCPA